MSRVNKIYISIIAAEALTSCSGYLTNNATNSGKSSRQVEKINLALEGGGYVSSDTANDITPFLFRDKSTGNAYLFFASDRGGTYAIYYAQMDSAGNFFNLKEMGPDINQTGTTNFSPVVFQFGGSNFISFMTVNFVAFKNSLTNIQTYGIDQSFVTNGTTISSFPISGISDFIQISSYTGSDGTPFLIAVDGTGSGAKTFQEYYFHSLFVSAGFTWSFTNAINLTVPHYSASEFVTTAGPATNMYIIYDTFSGAIRQLAGEVWSFGNVTNLSTFAISNYSSTADDAYPYVDTGGGYKVYFASDRLGKGFNLYRYNVMTYDKEVPSSLRSGF